MQSLALLRRDFLTAGALAPFLASCATDLAKFSDEPVSDLATSLGVCAASYVTLRAGKPGAPVIMSGCSATRMLPADPVFQAASLTKPLIAHVALKLVRDGSLDLRAPVSRYLPSGYAHRQKPFASTKNDAVDWVSAHTLARISMASLLNHSSGLPNWTQGTLTPEFEPGARWQYSGEGYLLLQAVLCAITSHEIEAIVSQFAFDPLGMRSSRLRLTDDIRDRVVESTSLMGMRGSFDFVEPNAAASLYTTSGDYAKLMSALLADPVLLGLTVSEPMPTDPKLGLSWGYGWGIEAASGGPYLWHWGNNPGFRAFAMASTTTGNGFVVFTNSERGLRLAPPLARMTVPAEHRVFRFGMLD